jgi:hypothetical protein
MSVEATARRKSDEITGGPSSRDRRTGRSSSGSNADYEEKYTGVIAC